MVRYPLQGRTEQATSLPATADPKAWTSLLRPNAGGGAWRLIEATSDDGRPFNLRIKNLLTGGAPDPLWLSAARSLRVCLFTGSIEIDGLNAHPNLDNHVTVRAFDLDTPIPTANVASILGTYAGEVLTIPIPNFAQSVRFDCKESDQANARLRLRSAATIVAETAWSTQPPHGLPVGGATDCRLELPSNSPFRVTFTLGV